MENVLQTLKWFHVMNLKGDIRSVLHEIISLSQFLLWLNWVLFFATGVSLADATEKALNPFLDFNAKLKPFNVSSWNTNWTEIYVSVAPQMEDTIFEVYLLNVVVNNKNRLFWKKPLTEILYVEKCDSTMILSPSMALILLLILLHLILHTWQ